MENNNDWKELEKWNAQNEENNKFYENSMQKACKNKKAKKFSKIANIFSFSIMSFIIITICTLALVILIFVGVFFHHLQVDTETEILQQLKNEYSQDFVIIEENTISDKQKVYKISPKNNTNIVFKAVQTNFNQQNDYKEYLIKDILQSYLNTLDKTNIHIIDSTNLSNKQQYYKLKYGINISTYLEIPDAVKEIYDCNDYISKKLNKEFKNKNFYFNGYLTLNNWSQEISNNLYNKSLETYIYESKYSYIQYLKNNNLTDSNITNTELNKIWFPKELDTYINGKNISENSDSSKTTYNTTIQEYELNFISILDYIPKIQKLYNKNGELSGFIYKDKEYSLYYSDNKLLGNKVPYKCSISSFKKIINCKISYDYNNKIIYINLFNT